MNMVSFAFQLIGSLGFLLYGMKMMSDGIQKSAGESMHRILGLMTGNRILAVFTGLFITMIIQSSSATTVMVVSFVNAGLLTLQQSVGVIFGANIGTTITAWIVSLFGFNFDISLLAVPVFGIGYFLTFIRRIHKEAIGEALMGFGLLFLGLEMLSNTIPRMEADQVQFLSAFTGMGIASILIGVIAGLVITVLIHSSSASTAIIITMSHNGLLPWEFAAAMVLGSNIGTTIDAVLASIGTKVNARRAALIHVIFNVSGTLIALIFFHPLLALVDIIVPGPVQDSITIHIAMLHTVFNVINTVLYLPFTNQLARLTEQIIKPKKNETPEIYRLDFTDPGLKDNATAYIVRAEKEIADMSGVVTRMFNNVRECYNSDRIELSAERMAQLAKDESYTDQMQEELSKFLVYCIQLPISEKQRNNISTMLRIIDDLESMSDECYTIALLIERSVEKKMTFHKADLERLNPYMDLVTQFLHFIRENINQHLDAERLREAQNIEDQIDLFRKNLKRIARKRLEQGADVKSELLYIDLVRNIEKIGDRAFSISEALAQTI